MVKDKKKKKPSWYQTVGLQTNYLATLNILQSANDKSQKNLITPQIESFINYGTSPTEEILERIETEVDQYLNN